MTYHDDHEERCRQIVLLLAYPKVGPLSAAAIAINLGTSEDDIRATLESLLQQGRIVRTGDGRLTGATAHGQDGARASQPVGSQLSRLERGASA